MSVSMKNVEQSFALAKERYEALGVDVARALDRLAKIPISLHCWQGDDVGGFEKLAKRLAADWRSRAIIRARPARPTSCAPIWTRRWRSSPAPTGSTSTPAMPRRAARGRARRDRARALPAMDRLGQGKGYGDGLQPYLLRAPQGVDGHDAGPSRRRDPAFWIDHGIACRKIGAAIGQRSGLPA